MLLKAIQYRNLDEARKVLSRVADQEVVRRVFDDQGEEPQGLLSVIPEDRLPEEMF